MVDMSCKKRVLLFGSDSREVCGGRVDVSKYRCLRSGPCGAGGWGMKEEKEVG